MFIYLYIYLFISHLIRNDGSPFIYLFYLPQFLVIASLFSVNFFVY